MSEWKTVKLGEVCEIYNGSTPSKRKSEFWGGNIRWATPTDISKLKGKYISNTKDKITEEGYKSCSTKLLPVNSVLFTSRASIGHIAITTEEMCTNQGFKNFVCSDKILPEFLYYTLKIYTKNIELLATGSTFKEVSMSSIRNFEIPLPPLPIQKQIVSILEKAENLKQKREETNKETQKIIQSLFYEMFGDPVKNEKGWDVKTLNDVCEINPKKSELNLNSDTNITFLQMASVSNEGVITNRETKKMVDVLKGFTYFKENDVLFAKITPCMENGKGALASNLENGVGFGSTEFHVLRPLNVSPIWLFILTKLKQFRIQAEKNMTGTAGQKRVPTKFLLNYKIGIPPLPLQQQFSKKVQLIESIQSKQQSSTEEINTLFDALMQKAFKGELVE